MVDRADRDRNQGRFGCPNADSENRTDVVPWGHAVAAAAASPGRGLAGARGTWPGLRRRGRSPGASFFGAAAKLGGNARSAARAAAPVTSPEPVAPRYDAVIVGAGPNGLTAAALLAAAGRSVLLLEAAEQIGGGASTEELTLPGYRHDVCSAIHPLAAGSPAFAPLALERHGLELAHPELALAHPLDDGTAGVIDRGFTATDASLGADAARWRSTFAPHARGWDALVEDLSGPLVHIPRHPIRLARFGIPSLAPAMTFARLRFREPRAQALFSGMAAHAMLPLTHPATASFGLVLGAAGHAVGWPAIRGGSQQISNVLAGIVRENGGEIVTGAAVSSLSALPPAPRSSSIRARSPRS